MKMQRAKGGSADSRYRVAFDGCLFAFTSVAGGRVMSRCVVAPFGARGTLAYLSPA